MTQSGLVVGASVPTLVRWGLTPDADLVFRTLATFGANSAGELAAALGMSRKRIDSALADLQDARSIARTGSNPTRSNPSWRAEPVELVVQNLRHRLARRAAPAARPVRRPAYPMAPGTVELGPGMRHLPTRDLTRSRLGTLVKGARHETLTFNPEPVFDIAAMQAAAPMDRTLMSRGVAIRIIGVLPPDPDRLVPHGGESSAPRKAYREISEVPMKMIIIDRQVALFPVDPRNYEHGYLEIVQTPVVGSLVETFERCWAKAKDPQENAMPNFALSPREEALIGLLVHGHTDNSAAHELQVSERSVSNMLRSLMDRLGVDNRFQLGVALGALHAAPHPPGLTALARPSTTKATP